jgi:carbonic anhydrase
MSIKPAFTKEHKIAIPFAEHYPDTLAICCSDGRYIEMVGKYLEERGVARHDLIALPGGPAVLCRETASAGESMHSRDAFDFLVESHRTKTVLLIAHRHCGYYGRRLGSCEEERQILDLRRSRERILLTHGKLDVQLFLAIPDEVHATHGFVMRSIHA